MNSQSPWVIDTHFVVTHDFCPVHLHFGQKLKKWLKLEGYGVAESLVRRFGQDGGVAVWDCPLWDNHKRAGNSFESSRRSEKGWIYHPLWALNMEKTMIITYYKPLDFEMLYFCTKPVEYGSIHWGTTWTHNCPWRGSHGWNFPHWVPWFSIIKPYIYITLDSPKKVH